MHDVVIRGGQVIDGTGRERQAADVAIDSGRIVDIGDGVGEGRRAISLEGQIVAPGFVDVHTHLDVQGFWDPLLTPSPLHGVTTAIGGNCGFSVAPLDSDAGPYLMRMLAKVEGIPLEALANGAPWDWTSTADYLDRLDGTLALNTAFSVGHSAIRRVVMGEDSRARKATEAELKSMVRLLREGLDAGAVGFSSTWSSSHTDAESIPVPSRWADALELVTLASVCRDFEGTSLEFLPEVGNWEESIERLMVDMTVVAQRPLNWNLIDATAKSMPHWERKLAVSDRARQAGGKIVGLVLPKAPAARFSFRSGMVLDSIPGFAPVLSLPLPERLAALRDPAVRTRLQEGSLEPSPMKHFANWGAMRIVEAFTDETSEFEGLTVADIATQQSKTPFDALLDIVVADDLRTSFCFARSEGTEADWAARAKVWRDPRAVVGASDAGAHLDMLATFSFATDLLAFGVRERGLLTTEEAVRLLTSVPAGLYGLNERGRIEAGAKADIVVFDETTVQSEPVVTKFDLPGGAGRLYAGATGIDFVLVNGVPIAEAGEMTGATPGTMLRAGRDTVTPQLA